jgi:hypothetical protein
LPLQEIEGVFYCFKKKKFIFFLKSVAQLVFSITFVKQNNETMKTLTITDMATGKQTIETFATEKEARHQFLSKCDLEGLDYELGVTYAGGIGYDYRIELN